MPPPPPRLSSYFEDDEDPPLRVSARTRFAPDSDDLVGRVGGRKKRNNGSLVEASDTASAASTRPTSRQSNQSTRPGSRSSSHSKSEGSQKSGGISKKRLREMLSEARKHIKDEHKITREEVLANESWPTHKAFAEVERIKKRIFDEQKESRAAFYEENEGELEKARDAAKRKVRYERPAHMTESWHLHRVRYMHSQHTKVDNFTKLQEDIKKALGEAYTGAVDMDELTNPTPPHHGEKGYFTYSVLHWCFRAIRYLMDATDHWIDAKAVVERTDSERKFHAASVKASDKAELIRSIRKQINRKPRKPLANPLADAGDRIAMGRRGA